MTFMGIDWQAVEEEAVEHLSHLVRIDTTNPPGNETAAAEYIAGVLAREGLSAQVLESAPGRGNLVARLRGTDLAQEGLMLLSHLDVVPAEVDRWRFPPFQGVLSEGYVWGRGTLDTKHLTVMELMAILLLHRSGRRLQRDVVLVATADEEVGGERGLGWLLEEHPDLVVCGYAINEGGGQGVCVNGHQLYSCQTAEKGVCWMALTARGETGHAAFPHPGMAIERLGRAVSRLGPSCMPLHPIPLVREAMETWLEAIGPEAPSLDDILAGEVTEATLAPYFGLLSRSMNAMLRNTATPTILEAGVRINVIPGEAHAELDGRILPGMSQEQVVREVREVIDDEAVAVDVKLFFPASDGGSDHALYRTIERVMHALDPGSRLVPHLLVAVSDARYLMRRGIHVCGFSPMQEDPAAPSAELIHGDDERISVENLGFGVRVIYHVVEAFCAQVPS
jgi:acetylornithine deacetylase/succinyl-diaminopimelate desuccinylase-like protein